MDFAFDNGLNIIGIDFSPIRGPEGNIEFLVYLSCRGESVEFSAEDVVRQAHSLNIK